MITSFSELCVDHEGSICFFVECINTEGKAPILVNQWNPFLSDTGYLFIGENSEKIKMTILVNPNTGKLIEIN